MLLAQYLTFLLTIKFWLSLLFILILSSIIRMYLLRLRMPPGPMPWPFLGNFPIFMRTKLMLHEQCIELYKKYGDPFTVFFATNPCVILTKYEQVKEILTQVTFSDRFDSTVLNIMLEERTMSFGPYDSWYQVLRRIAGRSMRTLIDADSLGQQVAWSTKYTVEEMLKVKGPIVPRAYLRNAIYNIVLSFAFGKTFKVDDPEFTHLLDASDRANKTFQRLFAFDFIPLAKHLPIKYLPTVKNTLPIILIFRDYGLEQIQQHRRTFKPGVIRDLTDALLNEQMELLAESKESLSDHDVAGIINDFYTAGTETSSLTLTWLVLFLTLHPEIQEECHQTIQEAIGDRQVQLSDRSKLTFIDACIMETLRLRPPAVMGLPRAPAADTYIGPHFVPKGTFTLANFYAMHTDPDYWTDPLTFDPRLHWLDESGQLRKPASFMAFGTGRRECLGERLAKNFLFLTVVNLVQKVKWGPVPGHEYQTDPDPSIGLALTALPYPVLLEERK